MTIAEMFGQSGVLTLLGMAVVFSFLIILVFSITALGTVMRKLGLDKDEKPASSSAAASATSAVFDGAVTAAIGAAIKEYRKE
ncbi:MAG: hypothetical protein Ta2F_13750 [Termitinemataceae bacterium]|nr:MAG: hypothetical protein Ta2F_13750 [Termitinemataceae bacterium]